jgi:hypothetical protein
MKFLIIPLICSVKSINLPIVCLRVAGLTDFSLSNSSMEDSFLQTPEEVCAHFRVNPLKGLSSAQVLGRTRFNYI